MFDDLPDIARAARANPAIAIAAVAVLLVAVAARRPDRSSGPVDPATDPDYRRDWLEYQSLVARHGADLARLSGESATNAGRLALDRERLRLESPVASQQCVPWDRWSTMTAKDRAAITQQVRNGKLVLRPSAAGMCLIVSGAGAAGHAPLVTVEQDAGFFGSSGKVTGPAGMVPGLPSGGPSLFGQVIDAAGRILG